MQLIIQVLFMAKKLFLILFIFLSLLFVSSCQIDMFGESSDGEHVHTFSNEWVSDDVNHWHESTCEHEVRGDIAEHSFGNAEVVVQATNTTEGVEKYTCTVCGYWYEDTVTHKHTFAEEWLSDNNMHWHASTCGCDEKGDSSKHTYGEPEILVEATNTVAGIEKYTCTTCEYSYELNVGTLLDHRHKYANEWTTDGAYHWRAATCEHTDLVVDKELHKWTMGDITGTSRVDSCSCGKTREVSIWDGVESSSLSGSGTEENPFLINNGADLAYFASQVTSGNTYAGQYVKLTKTIDLSYMELTIGIFNSKADDTMAFAGHFDGNDNSILNMYIDGANYTGLFVKTAASAIIENLCVSGNVYGVNYVGAIVAYNKGTIMNCYNFADVTAEQRVGGIVGESVGHVIDCGNSGNITGTKYNGGIVGAVDSINITDCVNYGTIISSEEMAGGICGAVLSSKSPSLTNCVNYGEVICEASPQYGALFGGGANTKGTITLTKCANYGSVNQLYPELYKDNKTQYKVDIIE